MHERDHRALEEHPLHVEPPAEPTGAAFPEESAPPLTRREARERERLASARGRDRSRPAVETTSKRDAVPEPHRIAANEPAARPAPNPVATSHFEPSPAPNRAAAPRQGLGKQLFSAGALLFAGALLVGTTVPANAFLTESYENAPSRAEVTLEAQELTVEASQGPQATRDAYSVSSYSQLLRSRYGSRSNAYTTTGTGPVRWPFPYAVPITDGWGERVSPCRGCSSYHQGTDFTPGDGAPIYAIADGTVSVHEEGGGFGNYVSIDHVIDGQQVTSLYAHMQWGSSPLVEGEEIKVGDFIGLVGDTGQSTGPHLHFEIHLDGVKVDPFAWLRANAS